MRLRRGAGRGSLTPAEREVLAVIFKAGCAGSSRCRSLRGELTGLSVFRGGRNAWAPVIFAALLDRLLDESLQCGLHRPVSPWHER